MSTFNIISASIDNVQAGTINVTMLNAMTSSINYVTSSQLNIGTNIITVNAASDSVRFGGLAVNDSGSIPLRSGSLLFDSQQDQWIFVHQSTATVTSSLLIMGPETYNNVGNEIHPTTNRIMKSVTDEHIGDSNITDTGTIVSINSNTQITGSLLVSGSLTITGSAMFTSLTGSLLGTASYASQSLSSSYATTASYIQNAQTASYVNTLSQDVIITGTLNVGGEIMGIQGQILALVSNNNLFSGF